MHNYVVSCPTWTKNIDRYLTWGAFKVGSMLCKSMALCMGLCNIFCFRIWLAVRIQSRRAWLVAWGLTEWTMVRWGTSSKTWTEVLQRGHEVFSKGTLNRCHSWNDKKKWKCNSGLKTFIFFSLKMIVNIKVRYLIHNLTLNIRILW